MDKEVRNRIEGMLRNCPYADLHSIALHCVEDPMDFFKRVVSCERGDVADLICSIAAMVITEHLTERNPQNN